MKTHVSPTSTVDPTADEEPPSPGDSRMSGRYSACLAYPFSVFLFGGGGGVAESSDSLLLPVSWHSSDML